MMKDVTGEEPIIWADSIVGVGKYQYKYASGRKGEWFLAGFSPRKQSLTLYIMSGFEAFDKTLEKLGKFKTGKSCLYINKLDDVDNATLKGLISLSADHMNESNA